MRKDSDRSSLDARLQNSILKWNKLDSALYDRAIKSLDQKIEKYGKEKMAADIIELNSR